MSSSAAAVAGYAKRSEAVWDQSTDLDLRNLLLEVTRREALTEWSQIMHPLASEVTQDDSHNALQIFSRTGHGATIINYGDGSIFPSMGSKISRVV
jgi:hypothetical protein